ncbi:MAG: hypothetical protein GXP29_07630 [Planctomycetes bacterium]|nr:hypothetical protein [Planctomycetota bacterium]
MKSLATTVFAVLLVFVAACACRREPASDQHTAMSERTLVGQLLLPIGSGSRGVEVLVKVTASGGEPRVAWVLFDEQGRFAHTFRGNLTSVQVTAAAEVHRIDTEDIPEVDQAGQIDVGVIDLRNRLTEYRLMVRAADGKPPGDVRVGMWFGLPPVGPRGEPVSLGSRQFPPVALGSELDWLLPHEAHSIYFLVERPSGTGRGTEWRSGHQRLFGPFISAELPAELIMD